MTEAIMMAEDRDRADLYDFAASALEAWPGRYSWLRLLKFRENAVFSAISDDGTRCVVRVHRAGYHSDEALLSELLWMDALHDVGMLVPGVVRSSTGAPFLRLEHDRLGSRQVDVLSWVDGEPACVTGEPLPADLDVARHFSSVGRWAALLHQHASTWQRPHGFTRHAWDADGLVGSSPLWGRFWELSALSAGQKDLLLEARDRARSDLLLVGRDPDAYGLIHADLVPENVLGTASDLAIIDFDDCGFGWYMFDLATVLYVHIGDPAYGVAREALIQGYRKVRALGDHALETLPLFLFLRSTTYLGWIQTRPETEAAREMTPMLVDRACSLAEAYLGHAN